MEENNNNPNGATEMNTTDINNMTDAEFNTFMKRAVADRAAVKAAEALEPFGGDFYRPAAVSISTRSCCGPLTGEKFFQVWVVAPGKTHKTNEAARAAVIDAVKGMGAHVSVKHSGTTGGF